MCLLFFKQKTAYEMRISDWSSDVCSSDLRSAAYVTRYLGKNIVAAGLARRCTIQLSYAIGVAEPLSIYIDLHGTAAEGVTEAALEQAIPQLVRLTPKGIRTHLGLNKPIYKQTRSEEHPSDLQSLMRIPYAVSCLKKKKTQ